VAKHAPVNTCVKEKRLDVGVERLEEIRADPAALPLVKSKAVEQVGFGKAEYPKLHASFVAFNLKAAPFHFKVESFKVHLDTSNFDSSELID